MKHVLLNGLLLHKREFVRCRVHWCQHTKRSIKPARILSGMKPFNFWKRKGVKIYYGVNNETTYVIDKKIELVLSCYHIGQVRLANDLKRYVVYTLTSHSLLIIYIEDIDVKNWWVSNLRFKLSKFLYFTLSQT